MDQHHDTDIDACHSHPQKKADIVFHGSLLVIVAVVLADLLLNAALPPLHHFAQAATDILLSMWWGVALGMIVIGIMSHVPREYFTALMGRGDNFSGLLRAVAGGLVLDLCCHGILLVAAKLYERGVSLGQVIAFLVASPWNSLSLTLVLIALIGLKWTLLYVLGSVLIALFTGWAFMVLVHRGVLPSNPNTGTIEENYRLGPETKKLFRSIRLSPSGIQSTLLTGWREGRMIVKWLLFGTVLAASIRAFVPPDIFEGWFGPTVLGLFMTLIVASIVEICSEGSAPIAGELFNTAAAPGNGFTFLMAGVATDYTEMLSLREFTKSWAVALALPAISVPQVLFLGWIMNMAGP